MIFIGNDAGGSHPATAKAEIMARDLLAGCAREIRQYAGAMQGLDTALGAVLDRLRSGPGPTTDRPAMMSPDLMADLQRADRLRQELEGVAKALELLVTVNSMETGIPSQAVRVCTPLLELQDRLLSRSFPTPGPGSALDR